MSKPEKVKIVESGPVDAEVIPFNGGDGPVPGSDGGLEATAEDAGAKHVDIRTLARDLRLNEAKTVLDLSVVVHTIHSKNLFRDWGYTTWKGYVEKELDLSLRTAANYICFQNCLRQLPKAAADWMTRLGYTRGLLLAGRISADNWEKFRALEDKSASQIEHHLDELDAAQEGEDGGEGGGGDASTKAKAPEPEKPVSVGFRLFQPQKELVDAALVRAKKVGQTDKDGRALELIAQEYLASHGAFNTTQEYLASVEKTHGIRIVAYDVVKNAVVFGGAFLDEMANQESGDEGGAEE